MPEGDGSAIDDPELHESPGPTPELIDTPAWPVWVAIPTGRAFFTVYILTMITILGNDYICIRPLDPLLPSQEFVLVQLQTREHMQSICLTASRSSGRLG